MSVARALAASRPADLWRLTRRVAGLSYLSRSNFLPEVTATEAARLRGLAARARGAGPAPLILLGVMPRSGTNFVHDLLVTHPDTCADPGRLYEFPLLHAAGAARGFMDTFVSMFPRNAEVTTPHDALALLAGAWLAELQHEAGDRHIVLKSPHVQNLTLAPLIFPGARIFLCLRDGRDVVESTLRTFSRRSLARKTFPQLTREWQLGAEAILTFADGGVNAHADVTVLRYEDLVGGSDAAVRGLLAHAGLDPARYPFDRAADMPVRGSSRSDRADADRWQPQARTDDFRPVGRWHDWPKAQQRRFDAIAGGVLQAAGYARHA